MFKIFVIIASGFIGSVLAYAVDIMYGGSEETAHTSSLVGLLFSVSVAYIIIKK